MRNTTYQATNSLTCDHFPATFSADEQGITLGIYTGTGNQREQELQATHRIRAWLYKKL